VLISFGSSSVSSCATSGAQRVPSCLLKIPELEAVARVTRDEVAKVLWGYSMRIELRHFSHCGVGVDHLERNSILSGQGDSGLSSQLLRTWRSGGSQFGASQGKKLARPHLN
jgi:hypothetical protein